MTPPERISRFLTYLLRHKPKDYPLTFDPRGFVPWVELVEWVQRRFEEVSEDEIRAVVLNSDKSRFELRGDSVRATYGHSFAVDLALDPVEPPAELYYGTARDLARSFLRSGLKPRDRQYVHLSASLDEAHAVGRRRDPQPTIIAVDTRAAREEDVVFYRSGPLFLTQSVPPKFLSEKKLDGAPRRS